jgi:hypothetical protein
VKVSDQWHVASSGVVVAINVSDELSVPVFTVEGLQYGCSGFSSEGYCLSTKLYGRAGLSLPSAQCGISSALLARSSSYLKKMFTFLISNFRRVLDVLCSLLGNSVAGELPRRNIKIVHVVLNARLTVFIHIRFLQK